MAMTMSIEGKIMLTCLEGLALSKYRCSAGVWTIGIGATVSEIPDIAKWPMDKTITVKEAFELLAKSLVKYERAVNKALKVEVTQPQFDALVSLCYNIGTGGVSGSTFIKRINSGLPRAFIGEAMMRWNHPKEIIGRRTKEAHLYETGVYPPVKKAMLFPVSALGKPQYSKAKLINCEDYI